MTPNKNDFSRSGPAHLKQVDWTNNEHRMMVAGSLAKSAHVLEYDRLKGTKLAGPWATSFNFNLIDVVKYETGPMIIGAIYEFKPPLPGATLPQGAPRYAIAFRGTFLKGKSRYVDMATNIRIILQRFHRDKRSQIAMNTVEGVVFGTNKKLPPTSPAFEPNVWVVGHSLGASLAAIAGTYMAVEKNVILEHCFLFNPPFPSLVNFVPKKFLPEKSKPKLLKFYGQLTDAFVNLLRNESQLSKDREKFEKLARWLPWVFVNRKDVICSRYISYFKYAQVYSLRAVVMNALFSSRSSDSVGGGGGGGDGDGDRDDEPLEAFYRFASAHLIVDTSPPSDTREAHKLHRWWKVKKEELEHTKHVWGRESGCSSSEL